MKTKILDLIREKGSEVISVRSDSTIFDAIQVMVNHNIGAVLVLSEEGKLKGIFTERDILKECLRRSDQMKSTKVEAVMTTDLIIGFPEDEVEYLMGVITENKIRHIPILSEGKISGVISIGDLVKSQLKDAEYENHYLRDYILGKYPA